MAKDLTIRILGRPQVSKDDAVGYQRISRQYVVEGYRASYAGINDSNNPLFLAVGTEDEEFEGHYLVDQKISPKQGSVDVAYLTREFVEIRDTWSSEQFAQSKGFKRVTRQFVAIRAVGDLGYTQENFGKHPHNNPNKEYSPWDYLATVVGNSEPDVGEEFSIPLNTSFNHVYRRSNISVDTKNPGFDVWSVTWTAPIRPEGEPSITKDSQLGYQTVSRSYVISGEYFTKSKIFDGESPLFIDVGTADHEYTDHYLVNQEIKPLNNVQEGEDSIEDLALLTRTFVKIRDTWSTENFSQSRGFKKITRQFVVLRAQHTLGYSEEAFNNHPVNTANKEYSPWKYLPTVVADSEPDISELFNIPTNIEFNQKWHRSTIAVDSKNPGVDVWSVSWTAPIRPEGEPTITKDSQIGFQTVTRSYVITGDYYTKANMFEGDNPLFLAVGTADHEYTDHYLVNQAIKPMLNMQKEGDDTVEDLAILTRQFVEIRDTHVQESVSTSNGLRRVRRAYVVLRAVNSSVGYTQDQFQQRGISEPWAYAPDFVKTKPAAIQYGLPSTNPLTKSPRLADQDLNTTIANYSNQGANSGEYLNGSCQVNTSRPGVDVWSIEWVTHTAPFWSNAGARTGSEGSSTPKVVTFDSNGLRIVDYGGGGGGSVIGEVATFTFFVVAEQIPVNLAAAWTGKNSSTPSVMLDFSMTSAEGDQKVVDKSNVISNAMFNYGTGGFLNFPTMAGGSVRVANVSAQQITFEGNFQNVEFAGTTLKKPISQLPMYKGVPIVRAGGTISWQLGFQVDNSIAGFMGTRSGILFNSSLSSEAKKIWRVVLTYVG